MSTIKEKQMMTVAVAAYQNDKPVIVFSTEGNLLHGNDDLQGLASIEIAANCLVIRGFCSQAEWNDSNWPEVFAAAHELWMAGRLPQQPRVGLADALRTAGLK